MPGELQAVSSILSGIVGGVELFTNAAKEKKAKAELARLEKPFYEIQDEYRQNRNLGAIQAGGGTPVAEQDYYTSESQRGLSAGIGGTLQAGGGVNDVAKMFDLYSKGIDRTAAASAAQHLKNMEFFKADNRELAGQKTTQWALNKYQPYKDKVAQLTQQIGNTQQNQYAGANQIVGSVSALGTTLENNKLLRNLLGGGGGGGGGSQVEL